jgi:hypothetical protein
METQRRRPVPRRAALGPPPKMPNWWPVGETWRGSLPKGMTRAVSTWPWERLDAAGKLRKVYGPGGLEQQRLARLAQNKPVGRKPSKGARLLKGAKTVAKAAARGAKLGPLGAAQAILSIPSSERQRAKRAQPITERDLQPITKTLKVAKRPTTAGALRAGGQAEKRRFAAAKPAPKPPTRRLARRGRG